MTADFMPPGQEDLIRAGTVLSGESDLTSLVSALVEQAQDIVRSDLAAFYLFREPAGDLALVYKWGRCAVPDRISGDGELVSLLRECGEAVLCNNRGGGTAFLEETLLADPMLSGAALPVGGPSGDMGVLFVNSAQRLFFNRDRFCFLDSLAKLAGGIMRTGGWTV